MNIKLLSYIFNEELIKGSTLESYCFTDVIDFFASDEIKPIVEKHLSQQEEKAHENAFFNILNNLKNNETELQKIERQGQFFKFSEDLLNKTGNHFLPGGWQSRHGGHALIYEINVPFHNF